MIASRSTCSAAVGNSVLTSNNALLCALGHVQEYQPVYHVEITLRASGVTILARVSCYSATAEEILLQAEAIAVGAYVVATSDTGAV